MGSTCGIIKQKEELSQVVIPIKLKKTVKSAPPPDEKEAKIGRYYAETTINKSHIKEWQRILFAQESAIIKNDFKFRKQLTLGIIKGIPNKYRWRTWTNILINGKNLTEDAYNNLKSVDDPFLTTIRRDLDRSFPYEAYFDKERFGVIGQAALERVLSKFAAKHSEIGYCQGMNFVVGFLLIVSGGSEIEVFLFLETLCFEYNLKGFYSEGMHSLKKCMHVAKRLLEKFKHKVFNHFMDEGLPDDLWLLKWLMTLFTMVLPGPVLVRIWDLFLIQKTKILYKTILAIITTLEPELLIKDTGDLAEFLSNLKEIFIDPEPFIKQILSFKIKKSLISKFEKEFDVIDSQNLSPCKEKLTTGGGDDNFKLPPLKLSPQKMKSITPGIKLQRTLSGNLSPSNKLTTVPNLPNIKNPRNSMRKKSFGVTNRSCDISINAEVNDL